MVKKFGGEQLSILYGAYSPGERLELILTVKMESRHPVRGSFSSQYMACVIIAEL